MKQNFNTLHPDIPNYFDCGNDYNFDYDCSDYENYCEIGSWNDYCNYNYDSIVASDHDSDCLVDTHFEIDCYYDCNVIHDLGHCDCYCDCNSRAHVINQNSRSLKLIRMEASQMVASWLQHLVSISALRSGEQEKQ